jgi:BirA family transcriptional regulator, biotin operon repressor / biotin---[acetyl-CoA-carboxylase] ligase
MGTQIPPTQIKAIVQLRFVPHNFCISSQTSNRTRAGHSRTQSLPTDARLGKVIRILSTYSTIVVSGTKLAQEIGTSRAEVWRLVQQLRRFGVSIEGRPATGYRLRNIPDLLLPEILTPLLRGTIFPHYIHHYFKARSTNDLALEAANDGAPEGSVFLAEQQTAGRGRGDHTWHSARGTGIYCSVVLRPKLPPSEVLVISLAAGLAVQSALQDRKLSIDLKWPNDLLIGDRKFSGILTEMSSEATRIRHIVVGFGVNVNQVSFPEELQSSAISLRLATGREWSRVEVCAALLKSFDREYRTLLEQPNARESILLRFQERSSYVKGRQVYVEENGGFHGVTYGLDDRGFLMVHTTHGIRVVLSGSIQPI